MTTKTTLSTNITKTPTPTTTSDQAIIQGKTATMTTKTTLTINTTKSTTPPPPTKNIK
jgi:hypothetical protein